MNQERARLTQQIGHADRQAERWERAAAALAQQRDAHRVEQERQDEVVAAAEVSVARVHAEVVGPLIEQATADGVAYLTARDRMWEAARAQSSVRRLGKRAAGNAIAAHGIAEDTLLRRWSHPPQTGAGIRAWSETATNHQAEVDMRVIQARRELVELEASPVTDAAQLVEERAACVDAERIAAERAKATAEARAAKLARFSSSSTDHRRAGPERDTPTL